MDRPGQDLAATLEEPGFYAGDPFPALRAPATRSAARLERAARLLGRVEARRRGHDLARSRDLLLRQGNSDLRDRGRVPKSAHDDAHRSARPHALPQARTARFRAVADARARDACAGPRRRARRPRRARRGLRRGRDVGRAVPALDHRRAARHPGIGLAPLLPVVGGLDPGRDRLAARGVRPPAGGDARVPPRDHEGPARRSARRHHLGARRGPRSTASRSATTSS